MNKKLSILPNRLIFSALLVVIGLFLIIFPSYVSGIGRYIVGILVILLGIGRTVQYLRAVPLDPPRSDLAAAVLYLAIGILLLINASAVSEFLPLILEGVIAFSALLKLQRILDALQVGYKPLWVLPLVLGVICLAYDVFLMFNPFQWDLQVLYSCVGVGLLYAGVTDILVMLLYTRRARRYAEEQKAGQPEDDLPEESGEAAREEAPADVSSDDLPPKHPEQYAPDAPAVPDKDSDFWNR